MNTEAKEIKLDEWQKVGEGNTADSYYCSTDDSLMLKLYASIIPKEFALMELEKAANAAAMGIPTPKAIEPVTAQGRYGTIFQRVRGKKSLAKILSKEPERAEELAVRFAREVKKLHGTECMTDKFPSAYDFYLKDIRECRILSDEQRIKATDLLNSIPSKTTCIHGDLNFGNVILDEADNFYFIDLPEFSYGNPMFDFCMYSCLMDYTPDAILEDIFHMDADTHRKAWDYFFREYFGSGELSGIKAEIKKYGGLAAIHLYNIFERKALEDIIMSIFR